MSNDNSEIKTIEPMDLEIPMSSDAMKVMAEIELPARQQAATELVNRLKPKVEKAVAANIEKATADISKDSRITELRQAGPKVRDIHLAYERERAAKEPEINRDRRLTEAGKGEKFQRMVDARDAKLATVQADVEAEAALARIWYEEPDAPPLSQAAISKGALFSSVYPHAPADTALARIGEWVAGATSGTDESRSEALALLYHVGAPLLARRSIAPEKHSEPFLRQYRDLAGMASALIDSWGSRPKRRIATEMADLGEQQFTFITNMAAQHGWDRSLEAATADFFQW
jgi:hypothetical protein